MLEVIAGRARDDDRVGPGEVEQLGGGRVGGDPAPLRAPPARRAISSRRSARGSATATSSTPASPAIAGR